MRDDSGQDFDPATPHSPASKPENPENQPLCANDIDARFAQIAQELENFTPDTVPTKEPSAKQILKMQKRQKRRKLRRGWRPLGDQNQNHNQKRDEKQTQDFSSASSDEANIFKLHAANGPRDYSLADDDSDAPELRPAAPVGLPRDPVRRLALALIFGSVLLSLLTSLLPLYLPLWVNWLLVGSGLIGIVLLFWRLPSK